MLFNVLIVPLFVSSFQRADDLANAMKDKYGVSTVQYYQNGKFYKIGDFVFEYLQNAYFNENDSHFDIDDKFTTDERGRMSRMKLSRMELSENGDNVLYDSIEKLKKTINKKNNEKNCPHPWVTCHKKR